MDVFNFAEFLRKERVKKGITQEELARRSGFTRIAVSYWENEQKKITLQNADRLLKALGVQLTIGRKDESYE